jgi:hypothetical protein
MGPIKRLEDEGVSNRSEGVRKINSVHPNGATRTIQLVIIKISSTRRMKMLVAILDNIIISAGKVLLLGWPKPLSQLIKSDVSYNKKRWIACIGGVPQSKESPNRID